LKPAHELILLARKPLSEPNVAQNVLKHGCGGINVDGCRIEGGYDSGDASQERWNSKGAGGSIGAHGYAGQFSANLKEAYKKGLIKQPSGRWPANFLLSHSEGCVRRGEKKVKGHKGYPDGPKGWLTHEYQQESEIAKSWNKFSTKKNGKEPWPGFADKNGLETVEDWECVEGCPIRELDLQSGVLKSGAMKKPYEYTNTGFSLGKPTGKTKQIHESNQGGASRFFKTFEYEPTDNWICSDDCPIKLLDGQSGKNRSHGERNGKQSPGIFPLGGSTSFDDFGGASRFFKCFEYEPFYYCAKASRRERNEGLKGEKALSTNIDKRAYQSIRCNDCGKLIFDHEKSKCQCKNRSGFTQTNKQINNHPTVKPVKLMRYLCRLITPSGGIVADFFMGSGSTGVACIKEGFDFIGVEKEKESFDIAEARINHARTKPRQERFGFATRKPD